MRIFVARLAGTPVFDPVGDQIGRVRDVVATVRPLKPPLAYGLVVEVQPRRRVFLPITRVRSIEPGSVIFSGRINMRRFEQRPTETLVIGELLDLSVTVGDERMTILDVAMEPAPPAGWRLTKIAVRKPGRGLRRGETKVVDWDEVAELHKIQKDQGAAGLLAVFETLRPADLAHALHGLTDKRRAEVATALDDDRLADVLEELPERDQIGILSTLGAER
ncbi:MAG TPA: magnesium transporter, partial [Thermopolyspora sp.]